MSGSGMWYNPYLNFDSGGFGRLTPRIRQAHPGEALRMDIPEFPSVDTLRKLWWLHDSFWHAALVKELGFEQANRINAEVASPTALYRNTIEGMSLPLSFFIEIRIAK